MVELVVEATGLRKTFGGGLRGGRVVAVDDLDLQVERGTVHGFLGPNGSGKTTTIRMLLGQTRPDRGDIHVLGAQLPYGRRKVAHRVGAVVERPRFSPDLSGRRNLELLAGLAGVPRARVDAVLERVGLDGAGRDRYRGYPPGMRQRLGVASALLRAPELLILDEPSHGLDPAEIIEMRELIRSLGADGVTVLLGSHILAEVQQVCAAVTIIGDGKVLATGRVEDLLGESAARTRVEVAYPDAAAKHLTAAGYTVAHEGRRLLVEGHEHPEEITRLLAGHDLYVSELAAVRPDLESFFLRLTGHRPPASEDPVEREADATAERLAGPEEAPA
ncbi:ABC transporter ATP-binding protein [Marmoricola sp. RAF53]|uniref:ABC transporter ATP-binding protein n=1 Tax=Marmoricola sp. RAF53 TaxID=3233059 RepID=UPI003F961999